MSKRLVAVLVGAAVALLAVLAVVVVMVLPKLTTPLVAPKESTASSASQTLLPFGRLELSAAGTAGTSVAVDRSGGVYVPDTGNGRVLKLAAAASEPTPLPIPGFDKPSGVAVDSAGTVYVIQGELAGSRLAKLSPGASAAVELPTSSAKFGRLAVGPDGVVYVAGLNSLERLKDGRFEQLPKPPGDFPQSVAVDEAGAIYVLVQTNSAYRIQKLSAAATSYTDVTGADLQVNGTVRMIALDSAGAIYFTGGHQVSKLARGSVQPIELPITDLMAPFGIAVGADGSVYVSDIAGGRVLKFQA
ncbi:hypothetical protein A5634_07590 [Mycobacterium asiaticum]|uniref:Uncharacterized protein n=1 Tax=Mycobacterium asiaticum TaxID=1790 RepID=A0A1A3NLK0_MYCAS|nr:hypothetical protein [Mycobacterium asiaticum]OBK22225.1 hypothetical protein A5634_07590 [Mycobacterium asiaticum]